MPGLFYFDSWEELERMLADGTVLQLPTATSLEARTQRVRKVEG